MAVTAPELAAIIARIKADVRAETGVDPLRRSIEYALIRALGGQSRGQYGYLKRLDDQAYADTADETGFWRLAARRGIFQKAAAPWTGVVQFTGVDTTLIPSGTELARSDGWLYETAEDGTISGGLVDVATSAKADYEGAEGSNDDGQALQLSTPIVGVLNECTVQSTTIDGSDVETQDDGLVRYLQDVRNPTSDGGGTGDYVRWALEVPGVTRAWEYSLSAGEVSVAFVRDGDGSGAAILPDAGERTAVQEYVQALAPITVTVSVITLTALTVNVTLSALTPNTSPVQAAIETELEDFIARDGAPGGTVDLSRLNEAISSAAGETSHALSIPAADVVASATQVPILGTVTFP